MSRLILFIMFLFSIAAAYPQSANIKRAEQLINNEKYLEAAKLLRPLADGGNAEAQYLAAGLFVEGKGVMKSLSQAEKYYSLAANSGHHNAAVELCDIYDESNRYEKSAQLLVNFEQKYKDVEDSKVGFRLGYYYYTGHGNLDVNKLLGWGMMYRSRHHLENESSEAFDKLKDDFYSYLLGTEDPNLLCQYFGYYYWKYMSKPEWTANYLDDLLNKIRTLPYEKQVEHFNAWEKQRLVDGYKEAAAVVLGMMYSEGIGTGKDYDTAKKIYSSSIDDSLYTLLLGNLYKNSSDGQDGHLKRSDFPEFWHVVYNDYSERQERWTYEKRKKDIKLICGATSFQLVSVDAYALANGNVTVEFEVYNKSPNVSGISTRVYSPGIRCEGKYYGNKNGVSMSGYIPGNTGIKGHTTTVFRIEIPKHLLPESKIIESVSFYLDSHWKKNGFISAQNVVWRKQ